MDERRPWFRDRAYGYGWYPATPEGWFVLIIWFLIIIGSTMVMFVAQLRAPGFYRTILFLLWAAVVVADSLALLYIAHRRGHKRHFLKRRR